MVSFIFGCLLFFIYTRMNSFSRNTYIIGLISSIIVMAFGGTGGGLGGLLALIGIIIYLLKVKGYSIEDDPATEGCTHRN